MTNRLWREQSIFVLGALLLTAVAAVAVAHSQWAVPGLVVLLVVTALSGFVNERVLLSLLVLSALLQPPILNLGSIPQLQLAELLVPLMLGLLITRWALRLDSHREAVGSVSRATRTINRAVACYAVVLLVNLVRSKLFIDSVKGTNRAYYQYFVAIALYFLIYRAFREGRMSFPSLRTLLLRTALIVSLIGLVAVALHLPLRIGDLRYSVADYDTGAVRVGFLEVSGLVGLAVVLTSPPRRFALPAVMFFFTALFVSGGRTAMVGGLVATALYLTLTRRSPYVVITLIVAAVVVSALPQIVNSPQVQRLTTVSGHEFNRDERGLLYEHAFAAFRRDPLLGTGIGVPAYVPNPDKGAEKFYEVQLETGGHATYASLLKNLGLTGLIPFVVTLLVAIVGLAPRLRGDPAAGCFFVLVTASAIAMIAGGNGSDTFSFFALAGAAAVLAREPRFDALPLHQSEPTR